MNQLLHIARLDSRGFLQLILRNYKSLHWEVQGFGMLRTYITSHEVRLHIWDSRLKVENVSVIHTHPWDFTSVCLSGSIVNVKYVEEPFGGVITHSGTTILCGKNAHIASPQQGSYPTTLRKVSQETYTSGDYYSEEASEIHWSQPADGTVTLVERHVKGDADHAKVYWDYGTEWVSAKPRNATKQEVEMVIKNLTI
jgi:hypothetical protein